MTGDQTPDPLSDTRNGGVRAEEIWTYAGRRERDGKRYYAWHDNTGQERWYAKVSAGTVGGRYALMVTRGGEHVTVYPQPRYTSERVDEVTSSRWKPSTSPPPLLWPRTPETVTTRGARLLTMLGAAGRDRREAQVRSRTRCVPRLRHPPPQQTVVNNTHR
ncbi:hypothetical protein ACFQX7_28280 [Luedemannella flava]